MEIVIASHNMHKIRELRELLKTLKAMNHVEILSLMHFPNYSLPPETGVTFQENALIKARDAAKHLGKFVIADDSGLVVPRLQGEPGIFSQRYAGPQAADIDNRDKLLKQMRLLEGIDRSAYFECCLALCGPNQFEKSVRGICEGTILTNERGRNGFGYDPLFVKHDYDKSFAELDEVVKNKISHRYKAFEKLVPTLETLFNS